MNTFSLPRLVPRRKMDRKASIVSNASSKTSVSTISSSSSSSARRRRRRRDPTHPDQDDSPLLPELHLHPFQMSSRSLGLAFEANDTAGDGDSFASPPPPSGGKFLQSLTNARRNNGGRRPALKIEELDIVTTSDDTEKGEGDEEDVESDGDGSSNVGTSLLRGFYTATTTTKTTAGTDGARAGFAVVHPMPVAQI